MWPSRPRSVQEGLLPGGYTRALREATRTPRAPRAPPLVTIGTRTCSLSSSHYPALGGTDALCPIWMLWTFVGNVPS